VLYKKRFWCLSEHKLPKFYMWGNSSISTHIVSSIDTHWKLYRIGGINTFGIISPIVNTSWRAIMASVEILDVVYYHSAVRGHHIYKTIWTPFIGEILTVILDLALHVLVWCLFNTSDWQHDQCLCTSACSL